MKKTTVLYFIDIFNKMGGAERNLFEIVTHLNTAEYHTIIMALQGGELTDDLKREGFEVYDLKLRKIYTLVAFFKAIWIFNLIKKNNVKIVVTYHESSDFLGGLVAKLAKVPVIISSRRDMGYNLKRRHVIIYRFLNDIFDKIITVSDAVKDMIFEKQNTLWHKMITVHNGVKIKEFSKPLNREYLKASLGLQINRPVVGILAALRPIKGHKYFLEAASLVLQKFPEVYFLIVGWYDPESNYYKELKDMTTKLNMEKSVIFTGGRSDIPEMLSIMDISAFSSINEGFSNAVLESMAAGKPVVATNSGGTPEAIVDGQTGF